MKNQTTITTLAFLSMLLVWVPAASAQDLPDVSTLFEQQKTSVVSIQTEGSGGNPLRSFFENQPPPQSGMGSGFVVDRKGHIITNNHVIQNASRIRVGLSNGEIHEATLIGSDPQTDIAVLKIEADQLKPVKFGRSDSLKVGEWVVAVGNPFGLDYSVTAGIISAKGREIGAGPYDNFLQTDASINPGNSGGPLFNMAGEVVGVNTAIIRDGQGIGFSVPIDMVTAIVEQLKTTGFVVRGFIGAGIQPLDALMAATFGLKENQGVLISNVEPNGPAQQAGVRPGDIITRFGGQNITTPKQLLIAVAQAKPGSSQPVALLRDGKRLTQNIRMAERPDVNRARVVPAKREVKNPQGVAGILVRNIDRRMAKQLGLRPGHGVIVENVVGGGPAAGILRRGDIILRVGERDIDSKDAFSEAVGATKTKAVRMQIERGGRLTYVALSLTKR